MKKSSPCLISIMKPTNLRCLIHNHSRPMFALVTFILLATLTLTGQAEALNSFAYHLVASHIQREFTTFMRAISILGEWYTYTLLLLVLFLMPKTRWSWGFPMAFTMILSTLGNQIIKRIFQVPRPEILRLYEASGYSFPSGHTMAATAFACICFTLAKDCWDKKSLQGRLLGFLLVLFPVLMGLSRIYLGVHTLSDVLAAYCLGYFVSFLSLKILRTDKHGRKEEKL